MKYTKFITALLAVGAFALGAHAADPPAAATYRALDDKLYVLGTDNDFQITYDSGDARVEIRDAAGNVLGRVTDAGTTGTVGFTQFDVINGSYASQITSAAAANRAVTLPDAAGEISLLGQGIASSEITDGTIINADVNAAAAIVPTKFSAGTNGQAVVTAAGASGWGTVPSAGITDDTIVNADINSAAAIAVTKLATTGASSGYVLTYNGSAIVWAANATGTIGGTGPLVDNAIPRMDGAGGATLQAYSSNTITASDAGLLTVPGGMLVQDDMEIEAASILLSDSADLYFARDDEIRWDILYTTGSETGVSGETSLAFDAYDNDGNFLRRALQLNRTASEGVVVGTVAAPAPLYVKGDIYAHTTDTQIVDDGKVLLPALSAGGGTNGQYLSLVAGVWTPTSGGTTDWANPGSLGATTPNAVAATTLTASGATTLNGAMTLGDAAADTLHINANTITFEGATADAYETTFAFTDPTADRTVTFPNRDGITATTTNFVDFDSSDLIPQALGVYGTSLARAVVSTYCVAGLGCEDGVLDGMIAMGWTPTDYDAGSVTMTVYWVTTSSSTNSAVWGVLYGNAPSNTDITGSMTLTDPDVGHKVSANQGSGRVNAITFTTAANTNAAHSEPFVIFIGRVGTDGSDDLAATAYVIGAKCVFNRR